MDDAHASREGIEQALYSLLPTGLAGVDAARGRARLRTLMTLRWLAVGGQTAAVLFVNFVLGFDVPLGPCLTVIAASAWLNVFLSFAMRDQVLLKGWEAALQLLSASVGRANAERGETAVAPVQAKRSGATAR